MATITSTQTGNWSAASTWVGGIAPVDGDDAIIAAGHIVTVDANSVVGDLTTAVTINATGELVVGAFELTLNGGLNIAGTLTLQAASITTFNGNYDLTIIVSGAVIRTSGVSASSRATLQSVAGSGFSIQDSANGLQFSLKLLYCNIAYWGRADAAADHALYLNGAAVTCQTELTNCLITDYWRIRSYSGATNADSTWKFINCDYRRPLMVLANYNALEYTTAADFNANTRGWWNCTFKGSTAGTIINKAYFDGSTNTWTNPLVVSNCIGEDILWWNRYSNNVSMDVVTHHYDYVNTDGSQHILFSNRSTAQGGWDVHDCVVDADQNNTHHISNGGGDDIAPATLGTFQNNITFGLTSGDNHYAVGGGASNWLKNITVGGNAAVSTGNTTETVGSLLERHTHIHKTGNFDRLTSYETATYVANLLIYRSCLLDGINDSGEVGIGTQVSVASQDIAYSDYNCFYQIADHYLNITVANKTITEGSAGYGASDVAVDPKLKDRDATLATWDTLLGGVGTVDNAFSEMMKMNGFDRDGVAAIFDSNYTKTALLSYLRNAFTPTNIALQATGFGGADIGALDVVLTKGPSRAFRVAIGLC